MTWLVLIYLRPGARKHFEIYERAALQIMSSYGGRIARRFKPMLDGSDLTAPHEIHEVTFPDQEAFEAYREDPRCAELASQRGAAIQRTVIWPVTDILPFEVEG